MIAEKMLAISLMGCALAGTACRGAGGSADGAAEIAVAGVVVTPELVRAGRTAYRKYCVQCHGVGGRGDGTSAAHLEPPPRDHTNAEVMDPIGDRVVFETIRFGGADRGFPGMPAFPRVSTDELVAMVAYVRSLSRPEVRSIDVRGLE